MSSSTLFLKINCCLIVLFSVHTAKSQPNRIKAGLLGLPYQPGFVMGNVGFERMNKAKSSSFQIQYSMALGSVAADVGDTKRKWFTAEKTFYVKSQQPTHFAYGVFIEVGTRIKSPGYVYSTIDSIPQNNTSFEVSPGIAFGFHHNFNKHWGMGLLTGPKLIFTNKQTHYYNAVSHEKFIVKSGNTITTGFRFTPYFCYQF